MKNAITPDPFDVESDFGRVLNRKQGKRSICTAMMIIANLPTLHSLIVGTHDIASIDAIGWETRVSVSARILEIRRTFRM